MNQLPHAANVDAPEAKVRDYLLDPMHPQNRGKFLRFSSFGFRREQWQVLAEAIRRHPLHNEIVGSVETAYGTKYVVKCHISSPDGRDPCIKSVWMIEPEVERPRLVSAY